MRKSAKALWCTFKSFLKRERGVAVVEFALVVPLMLTVYIGCSEAASLLTVDRKVQSVAGAVGDLVARSNKTLTKTELKDYFLAATSILAPYDATGLNQIIIAVSVSSQGEATVLWSARYAGGVLTDRVAEYPKGKKYNLPSEMKDIATGQTVIAAETAYDYSPLIGVVFDHTIDLRRSALFMPRFGGTINLT